MLLDNKNHGKVVDELRATITHDSKIAVLTGLFSIFGFAALKSELSKVDGLRLLLANADAAMPKNLAGTLDETGLKNELNLQRIAGECAEWVMRVYFRIEFLVPVDDTLGEIVDFVGFDRFIQASE